MTGRRLESGCEGPTRLHALADEWNRRGFMCGWWRWVKEFVVWRARDGWCRAPFIGVRSQLHFTEGGRWLFPHKDPPLPPSARPARTLRTTSCSPPLASQTPSRTSAIAAPTQTQSRPPTEPVLGLNSSVSFFLFARVAAVFPYILYFSRKVSCLAAVKPWEHCMIFPRLWLSAHNAILRQERQPADIKSISRYDPSVQSHPLYRRDRTPPGSRNVHHHSLGDNQWWRALGASPPSSHH